MTEKLTAAQIKALQKEHSRLQHEVEALQSVRAPKIRNIPIGPKSKSEAVAFAIASDWHVDEIVDPLEVNGLNCFDRDVAKDRAEWFFRNALSLAKGAARDSQIKVLYWAVLGDMISGWIHDELAENSEMPPVEAAVFVGDLLASGLAYWLRHSKFTIVGDLVCGNHGRLTDKMRSAPVGTSLETMIYQRLIEAFKGNPRVQLARAPGARTYRRFGDFTIRLIHGYEIGFQGGVGGVTIPIRKKISAWDKAIKADLTMLGHFHQLINGGDFLVNASLIGYTPYAERLAASPEPPRQAFGIIHHKHGLALNAPIWLTAP